MFVSAFETASLIHYFGCSLTPKGPQSLGKQGLNPGKFIQKNMRDTGWGSDAEIEAIGKLTQTCVKVVVNNNIINRGCLNSTEVLYIVHTNANNKKDRQNHYCYGLPSTLYKKLAKKPIRNPAAIGSNSSAQKKVNNLDASGDGSCPTKSNFGGNVDTFFEKTKKGTSMEIASQKMAYQNLFDTKLMISAVPELQSALACSYQKLVAVKTATALTEWEENTTLGIKALRNSERAENPKKLNEQIDSVLKILQEFTAIKETPKTLSAQR